MNPLKGREGGGQTNCMTGERHGGRKGGRERKRGGRVRRRAGGGIRDTCL